jgi:hypothetical protein
MGTTGKEQNTFSCCGLTGIDVSHDSDISGIFQVIVHQSVIPLAICLSIKI